MRKLYEIFKLLWIQKRIVAAATIWGNTVDDSLSLIFSSVLKFTLSKQEKVKDCPWVESLEVNPVIGHINVRGWAKKKYTDVFKSGDNILGLQSVETSCLLLNLLS